MHKNALLTNILVKRLDMPSCALYMSYITHVDLHLCLFLRYTTLLNLDFINLGKALSEGISCIQL